MPPSCNRQPLQGCCRRLLAHRQKRCATHFIVSFGKQPRAYAHSTLCTGLPSSLRAIPLGRRRSRATAPPPAHRKVHSLVLLRLAVAAVAFIIALLLAFLLAAALLLFLVFLVFLAGGGSGSGGGARPLAPPRSRLLLVVLQRSRSWNICAGGGESRVRARTRFEAKRQACLRQADGSFVVHLGANKLDKRLENVKRRVVGPQARKGRQARQALEHPLVHRCPMRRRSDLLPAGRDGDVQRTGTACMRRLRAAWPAAATRHLCHARCREHETRSINHFVSPCTEHSSNGPTMSDAARCRRQSVEVVKAARFWHTVLPAGPCDA